MRASTPAPSSPCLCGRPRPSSPCWVRACDSLPLGNPLSTLGNGACLCIGPSECDPGLAAACTIPSPNLPAPGAGPLLLLRGGCPSPQRPGHSPWGLSWVPLQAAGPGFSSQPQPEHSQPLPLCSQWQSLQPGLRVWAYPCVCMCPCARVSACARLSARASVSAPSHLCVPQCLCMHVSLYLCVFLCVCACPVLCARPCPARAREESGGEFRGAEGQDVLCSLPSPPGIPQNPQIFGYELPIRETEMAQLTCRSSGSKPAAQLHWKKGNKELQGRCWLQGTRAYWEPSSGEAA